MAKNGLKRGGSTRGLACGLAAIVVVPLILGHLAAGALAQDRGSVNPQPLPPLANPNSPTTPAKELFGRKPDPAPMAVRSIGFYSKGCLAGANALPIDGDAWQVMRLSRNRNWGHPALVAVLERISRQARQEGVWNGLLVGDMSQPRGGPMRTGHASHQIGLDADIWLTPMPNRTLNRSERENMSAVDMVRPDRLDIDPNVFSQRQVELVRIAAQQREVERIFVNAAIKKAMCRMATGNRSWLAKVRPYYQHNYHFHVRITCPAGSEGCTPQDPPPSGDGCDQLDYWFSDAVLHPKPNPNWKPRPPLTMAQLPDACRAVLNAK
ncbi:penicillin-insensitive murein endopeptidase [Beijerinckia sp. GAS462]|nr:MULTISPECIES: penicillin-insensitive murein endopeptidase [unclassified Beijerinckia]MDH7797396.1 penicillin-insensitive murein endopeptidase [Beijerinckia sp. GAS462]SEC83862.1 murein endopeptidase. Metallo peptidase. MEROPS family M74 [Beijerinckia sp. 28-YEA-48]